MRTGTLVALRSDPTITGWVVGSIDTPNYGTLSLVSWMGPDDTGEPEEPNGLIEIGDPT